MSDLHPLSGAFAVDALDDLERARFERHLVECPDCAAEVSSLREAAAMLAASVETGPTPALRSRVLSEIKTIRPLPPEAPVQEVARRTARWFPKVVAAAAAAVLLATGVGVSAWHPWSQTQTAQVSVASRVMDAPDARNQTVSLDNGGTATLWHSKSVDRTVLVTKNMPATPKGKAYELWFQAKNFTMSPAGMMEGGAQTYVLHGRTGSARAVGITVEPAGGSRHPSSAPIVMFDLSKSV